MAPTLGYWSVRGYGEAIRNLLCYIGKDFEDKLYDMKGTPTGADKSEWRDVQDTLGLEFPNLPYFIDGDVRMTETHAILRYIGRKNNLLGNSDADTIRVDVAFGVIDDVFGHYIMACYSPDFEKLKVGLLEQYPKLVGNMSKLVGSNKFVLGDSISAVDFLMFEVIERYINLEPSCLANFPNLKTFLKHMEDLPAIKKRRASENFQKIKTRYNSLSATFGVGADTY